MEFKRSRSPANRTPLPGGLGRLMTPASSLPSVLGNTWASTLCIQTPSDVRALYLPRSKTSYHDGTSLSENTTPSILAA